MGSSRLRGKVLADLGGLPVVEHVVRRARRVTGLSGICLATTGGPEDDALAAFGLRMGLSVTRGDADDVAGRVLAALPDEATHFVRLNGDSPFLDPELISSGLRLAAERDVDLVTNIPGRTYPYGVSVEIVRVAHFKQLMATTDDPAHREHVTSVLYAGPETRRQLMPPGLYGGIRTVVDTAQDLKEARRVTALLGSDVLEAAYPRVAEMYIRVRAASATNA